MELVIERVRLSSGDTEDHPGSLDVSRKTDDHNDYFYLNYLILSLTNVHSSDGNLIFSREFSTSFQSLAEQALALSIRAE